MNHKSEVIRAAVDGGDGCPFTVEGSTPTKVAKTMAAETENSGGGSTRLRIAPLAPELLVGNSDEVCAWIR
jgi:hypothetical protein